VIKLFFDNRDYAIGLDDWTTHLTSVKNAILEQLNIMDETSDNTQAFTSMFYHYHSTGYQTWATTFLKCLAGRIIELKVLNLSERLRLLIGESGTGVAFESLGHETMVKSNIPHHAKSIGLRQRPKEFTITFSK
jgi:hypothetical protein